MSDQYFGSCKAAGYADARRRGAIRFIVELTGNDREACNEAERRLLHGLQVDKDRRFWNQHKAAGAGYEPGPGEAYGLHLGGTVHKAA